MLFDNKKAVSPLAATIILIIFSLLLGTVTMNLGKAYIEEIANTQPQQGSTGVMQKYIDNVLYQCAQVNPSTQECLSWQLVK